MAVLQATSTRAANRAVVRNYAAPFSGPQCYCQKSSRILLEQEPRVSGAGVATRIPEFMWLQCSDCVKWRRVDLPTGRFFDARVWRQELRKERRRALLSKWPSVVPFLHGWWEVAEFDVGCFDVQFFQVLLRDNGFEELVDGDKEVALLELLEDFLLHYDCASVDVSDRLVAYWNAQGGVRFVCADLSDCACVDADDWDVRRAPVDFDRCSLGQSVVVYWREPSSDRESTLRGVVRNTERHFAEPASQERLCSVKDCGRCLEAALPTGRQLARKTGRQIRVVAAGLCYACWKRYRNRPQTFPGLSDNVALQEVPASQERLVLQFYNSAFEEGHFVRGSLLEPFQSMRQPAPLLHAARRRQLNFRTAVAAGSFSRPVFHRF